MKKRIILSLSGLIVLASLILLSLSLDRRHQPVPDGDSDPAKRLKVAATIFPLYDILRNVGGDKIDTILILPPGASPHTHEATPGQIRELEGAKLLLAIGAGADDWASGLASGVAGLEIIKLDRHVSLRPFQYQGSDHGELAGEGNDHDNNHNPESGQHGHEAGSLDPHYWLSPDNALVIARQIAAELSSQDPENQAYYQERAASFISELEVRAAQWRNRIKSLDRKEIAVFHDAWGYFADYFGLKVIATFEPFPGKAPTPRYLLNWQRAIDSNGLTALFVEPQLSSEAVMTLAKDLRVKIEVLDPLGGDGERSSYIDLLDYNVNSIYKALK